MNPMFFQNQASGGGLLKELHDVALDLLFSLFEKPLRPLPALDFKTGKAKNPAKQKSFGSQGIHHIGSERFKEVEPEGSVISEWVNISGKTASVAGRVSALTEYDFEELAARDLDTEKAEMIKPQWAEGKTAAQIVRALNGSGEVYGLGQTTVERYVSAFNAALRLETNEG